MKDILIYGTGDFADIVTSLAIQLNRIIGGYILDDQYVVSPCYNNKEVIPLSKLKSYSADKYSVVIGFIGDRLYVKRSEKFNHIKSNNYQIENLIHPSSVISTDKIGEGNIILEGCVLGYNVKMGNGNIMWPLSAINHHGVVGDFNNISPSVTTSGNVIIGSHCFLGNNSTYKNKVTVADYSFIGAGAYISFDTDEYGVYVPARSIKLDKSSKDFM